jgi:hypothetical protein
VLRLSSKRVRLQVGARAMSAALVRSWPRRAELAQTSFALGGDAQDLQASARQVLLAGVERALDQLAAQVPLKPAGVHIELADALVHFDVVRGEFGGHSPQQLAGIARVCLRELLGDSVDDSELRWHLQADGQHLWICAVPLPLLADLRDAVKQRGLRLRSLEPAFTASWNRYRKTFKPGLGVLARVSEDHAVVALARNGIVEALSTARCEAVLSPVDSRQKQRSPLDMQVRQLVTSLGVDTRTIDHFVALAEPALLSTLGPHWERIETPEGSA